MILKILRYPNPLLKKKSKAVNRIDDRIKKLIKNMIETMQAAPGVGLAAVQVGELIRLIVVDVSSVHKEEKKGEWEKGPFALVNPKIKKRSGQQVLEEGCLCLPGIVGPVERSAKVTVEGLDRDGKKVVIEAEGYLATVLQHEIDHLEGLVFLDRIKDKTLIREISPKKEPKEDQI